MPMLTRGWRRLRRHGWVRRLTAPAAAAAGGLRRFRRGQPAAATDEAGPGVHADETLIFVFSWLAGHCDSLPHILEWECLP